ncbi:uncharacterized protein BO80DRAFT_420439 [Aspergillus ibericus CBS 121593]|uniref:Uncharacterized protein n=1 Tax=Aspergillus ibericus CBS 121593 TaxID=1448316 RepID=A0A395HEG9_9EURO|nr:hypothetical protein BO80DRAFT_420439 [Aspergillus ibericus CBS 121593]RAL06140.1 hypothetical protein BO80DRAFT_420439 [Aspergillus ibericus CBS 121593]
MNSTVFQKRHICKRTKFSSATTAYLFSCSTTPTTRYIQRNANTTKPQPHNSRTPISTQACLASEPQPKPKPTSTRQLYTPPNATNHQQHAHAAPKRTSASYMTCLTVKATNPLRLHALHPLERKIKFPLF